MCRIDRIGTKALLRALGHTPYLQVGIGTLLASERGRFFSMEEIAGWIWRSEAPAWAQGCIAATICRLRRKGVAIECRWTFVRQKDNRKRTYYAMARDNSTSRGVHDQRAGAG